MTVEPIPAGYHTITPYLFVEDAARFIDFLKQAFDAQEIMRMATEDGTIRHAEVRIGDSPLMLTDARHGTPPTSCMIHLYVEDADAVYQRALEAGAESEQEPTDQFYGDRSAGVKDQFGIRWHLATHVEDVSPDEVKRHAEAHQNQTS